MRSIFGVFLALAVVAGPAECLKGGRPSPIGEFPFMARIEKNNFTWCLGVITSPVRVLFPDDCLRKNPSIGFPTAHAIPMVSSRPLVKYKGWFDLDYGEMYTELDLMVLHLIPPGLALGNSNQSDLPTSVEFAAIRPGSSDVVVVGRNGRVGTMTILDDDDCYNRLGKLYFPVNDRMQSTKLVLGQKMMCAVLKNTTASIGDVPPGQACELDLGAPAMQDGAVVGIVVRSFCPRFYPPVTLILRVDSWKNDVTKNGVQENEIPPQSSLDVHSLNRMSNMVERQLPVEENEAQIDEETTLRDEVPCTPSSCDDVPVKDVTESKNVRSKSNSAVPAGAFSQSTEDLSSADQAESLIDDSLKLTSNSVGNEAGGGIKKKRELGGAFMNRNLVQKEEYNFIKMMHGLKNKKVRRYHKSTVPGAAGFSVAASVAETKGNLPVNADNNVSEIVSHSSDNLSKSFLSQANLIQDLHRQALFEAVASPIRIIPEKDVVLRETNVIDGSLLTHSDKIGLNGLKNILPNENAYRIRPQVIKPLPKLVPMTEQDEPMMEMLTRSNKSQGPQRRWAAPEEVAPGAAPAGGVDANNTATGANNSSVSSQDSGIANGTSGTNATAGSEKGGKAENGVHPIAANTSTNASSDLIPVATNVTGGNDTAMGNTTVHGKGGGTTNNTSPIANGTGTEDVHVMKYNISDTGEFNESGEVVLSGGDTDYGVDNFEGSGNDTSGSGLVEVVEGCGESADEEILDHELELGPTKKPVQRPTMWPKKTTTSTPPETPPPPEKPGDGDKHGYDDPEPVGPPEPNDDRPAYHPLPPGKPGARQANISPKHLPLNFHSLATICLLMLCI